MDVADDEVTPKKYDQAALSQQWRDSMLEKRIALKDRGCCCVVRTPEGVKLIKWRYVYKIKRDWKKEDNKAKISLSGLRIQWTIKFILLSQSHI